jgi:Ran GTPase-activating protein (RanGAP) involved in mRNA processing and transport
MTQCPSHVACDGRSIALDDIKELETMQRKKEIWQELFRNAARIRRAVRSNAWLRPIFRKYKNTCREILDQKNQEVHHFMGLCNYCSNENDLKPIREELEHIHAQMKELEYMPSDESDESDESEEDQEEESEEDQEEDQEEEEEEEEEEEDADESDESDDDSSSSSTESMDLEDFL